MKNALIGIVAVAGLATAASAQNFVLLPGQVQFRIVANNTTVEEGVAGDNVVQMALQVRYNGSGPNQALAMSLGAARGSIRSGETDTWGTLARSGVRTAPYGSPDFGLAARQGVTEGHRELFAGGAPINTAPQNGGNPNSADLDNPFNGGGEFRWDATHAGFDNILAFDAASSGVGRPNDDGLGTQVSVGLHDGNNGVGGAGIEIPVDDEGNPTAPPDADFSRWDTIFLFNYTVTNFAARTISFDWHSLGSAANPGTAEDAMLFWNESTEAPNLSNAALGLFLDDQSDNITVVPVPAPGAIALLGLGGLVAGRRRRA